MIRREIGHAKLVVGGLVDGDRTVGEQEDEIVRVRVRVDGLRALLGELGDDCARGG